MEETPTKGTHTDISEIFLNILLKFRENIFEYLSTMIKSPSKRTGLPIHADFLNMSRLKFL